MKKCKGNVKELRKSVNCFSSLLCHHRGILKHFLSKKNDKKKVRDPLIFVNFKEFIQFDFDDFSIWFLETHH